MLSPTSRYAAVETAEFELEAGRTVRYLRRRFVPAPEQFVVIDEHVVVAGDRLGTIAAPHPGGPGAVWRVADAEGAPRPRDPTPPGGRRARGPPPGGPSGGAPG